MATIPRVARSGALRRRHHSVIPVPRTARQVRKSLITLDLSEHSQTDCEQQLAATRRQLTRRPALWRLPRHIASEPDPIALLSDLLAQAVTLIGGDEGLVFRWDDG